ncbi:nucleotidyltransferase domain-containing protein [Ramlibacter sp.]|uniref:nucleotidyltransferase domain-containing protein n=1 Tax=Ramlibacter sp. TaxID=1917967 RepID=UPI003D144202
MTLLDALIPRREQRLLRALVLHPDRSFSVNELCRLGGDSKSASMAIIERFSKSGLIGEERVGNQRRMRFNEAWPLAQELRTMCVKSFGVAEPIREALGPLIDRVQLAFVFGSVAKGTDHAGSDIDLMVVGEVTTVDLIEAMRSLDEQLMRPVSFNIYSPVEWQRMQKDPVIASIMAEPRIIIHERTDATQSPKPAAKGLPEARAGRRRR